MSVFVVGSAVMVRASVDDRTAALLALDLAQADTLIEELQAARERATATAFLALAAKGGLPGV